MAKSLNYLHEVVCEIRFTYQEGHAWDSTYISKFFDSIKDNYPHIEPSSDRPVAFHITNQGVLTPNILPSIQKIRYYDAKKNTCIILASNGVFGFSILNKEIYTWNELKKRVTDGWKSLKKCIKINAISQIGLRYINHIPPLSKGHYLSSLFNEDSDYIPKDFLTAQSKFMFNSEKQISENNILRLFLAEAELKNLEQNSVKTQIIFDIDNINIKKTNSNLTVISKKLDDLHTRIEDVFFKSVKKVEK